VIVPSAVRDIGTAASAAICRANARAIGQRCAASDQRSPFLSFKPNVSGCPKLPASSRRAERQVRSET
jgi:hypothetical protein